ncbi:MAG: hypothetical protein OEX12_05820 [Gammaproteobacteria bacterium]|nr:hypothetical protein [Gammaproteobacteria bacterium]
MSEAAGKHIGQGLAWFGFWMMIGLANFGEEYSSGVCSELLKSMSEPAIEQRLDSND